MVTLFRNYDTDQYIDIEYNEQTTATIVPLNEVGATGSMASGELFYSPPADLSDSNTVYISQLTGNDSNPGTSGEPVQTLTQAQTLCTTGKTNIMILDSETYNESVAFTGYVTSLYAAKGQTPVIIPKMVNIENERTIISDTLNNSGVNGFKTISYINDTVLIITKSNDTLSKKLYVKTRNKNGVVELDQTLTFNDIVIDDKVVYNPISHRVLVPTFLNVYETGGIYTGRLSVKLFNEDFTATTSETPLVNYSDRNVQVPCVKELSNGHFVVIWFGDRGGTYLQKYMVILSPTLEVIANVSISSSSDYPFIYIQEHNNYLYVIYYSSSLQNIYKYTLSGGYVDTISMSAPYALSGLGIPGESSRYAIVCLRNGTTAIYLSRLDLETGQFSGTIQLDTSAAYNSIRKLQDGLNAVCWRTSTYYSKYLIFDNNLNYMGNGIKSVSTGSSTYTNDIAGYSDGSYLYGYSVYPAYTSYYSIRAYDAISLTVNQPATIGGCVIRHGGETTISTLLKINNNVTLQYCTIDKSILVTSKPIYAITGTGNVTLNSCLVATDGGCNITGSISAQYCQFINIYNNYALKATSSINVNHCDFVNCYGAAQAPTVNITNSIIYRPAAKQLDATTYTYTNSVDTVAPLAGEQYVVHSTPAYINDGVVTPSLRDLNLRMRILGYPYDSDAAYIATDGYHAGSLLVSYSNVGFSYDRVRLPKDRWGIKREIDIVGEVKLEKKDGSDSTYKDALKEVITIKWRAMTIEDFEKLLDIIAKPNSRVRVYFNPMTHPDEYISYTVVYSKLPASVDDSIYFSSRYVKDVSLTLTRGLTV